MESLKYIIQNTVAGSSAENPDILDININSVLHKFILASNTLIKHIVNYRAPNLYANRITGEMYYIAAICYSKQCINTTELESHNNTLKLLSNMYVGHRIQMLYVDATRYDTSSIYVHSNNNTTTPTFCGLNELFDMFQIDFRFNNDTCAEFIQCILDTMPNEHEYYSPDSSPVVDGMPFTPMRKFPYRGDGDQFKTPSPSPSPLVTPRAPKKPSIDQHTLYTPLEFDDDEEIPLINFTH